MVSGSLLPKVSGKRRARAPATEATQPMMKTGAGSQYTWTSQLAPDVQEITLRLSRSSAEIPPILATREQVPTAWFLEMMTQ